MFIAGKQLNFLKNREIFVLLDLFGKIIERVWIRKNDREFGKHLDKKMLILHGVTENSFHFHMLYGVCRVKKIVDSLLP